MHAIRHRAFLALLAMALMCGMGWADVEISLTLTGDVEEISAILGYLKSLGVGTGQIGANDTLQLEVHSIHSSGSVENLQTALEEGALAEGADENVEAPAEEEEAQPPLIILLNPQVDRKAVAPGKSATITVELLDDENAVDTIGMTVGDTGIALDLYDNGTRGDKKAHDGVWSILMQLPKDMPAGEHVLTITAFDVNGAAIQLATGPDEYTPLVAHTTLLVQP